MVEPTSEDDAEFSADDDDEDGGESTVAMQSPSFDPSMPSPVSIAPPPGFGAAQSPMVPTAPVAFSPPGARAAIATPARPEPAKPFGMTAQSAAIAPGTFARSKRAQTVIGIAPPGQGAQRPPTSPLAAPPQQQRPPPSVPRSAVVPQLHEDDGEGPISETAAIDLLDPMGSPPTLTAMGKTPEQMFGLDEAAGAAARAAVRPNVRHSPLASTGFAPGGAGAVKSSAPTRMERPAPPRPPLDQESTATAFVEDLGFPLTKAAGPGGLPKLHDNDGDDESTRAVPREELFRDQDQFILGEDAGVSGDDATLAVAPGMNDAALQRLGGGMASPLGADGSGGHPEFLGNAHATQQSPQFPPMLGPPPSWNTPSAPGMQPHNMTHGMAPTPSATSAMPMMPGYPGHPGQMPSHGGQSGQMPYPPNGTQGQQMPMGYPNVGWPQQWGMPGPQQMAPVPRQNGKFPLSGQVIALGLVGIVCLAIFVTGVVLFFTTKF